MFLLLLIVLGTANIKAQVRIGGDGAPNTAAVLDLNATDATTGTKGLALPRVSLTDVNAPLTGTPVVNGMMVYNTNVSTTGGSGVGIYYWNGQAWQRIASGTPLPGTIKISLDTSFAVALPAGTTAIAMGGKILWTDICHSSVGIASWDGTNMAFMVANAYTGLMRVRCYRLA